MIYSLDDKVPQVDKTVYIAPGAHVIGDVHIGAHSSIWFNTVVRGDVHFIRIGRYCNIQDNSVIHVTTDKYPTVLEDSITIAHNAVVHGAHLHDYAFVGISATVMDNVTIHPYGFVAAGALVPPNFEVPSKTLVAGVPAKIIRPLRSQEIEMMKRIAQDYSKHGQSYSHNLKPLTNL